MFFLTSLYWPRSGRAFLFVYHLPGGGENALDWLAKHSSAIQAIASIAGVFVAVVLAGVTYWYVGVTRAIANSSLQQLGEMKAAAHATMQKNIRTLGDLALRIRNSLAALDADAPRDNQLRAFNQVNESDISRLEVFASQLNNAVILAAESAAVLAIREILATIGDVKGTHPGAGWQMRPGQIENWRRAREGSDRSLHEIENECARILGPEAGV